MRILHTVEFYHPGVGGAEHVVRRISEGLAARGHEVVVATSPDSRRTTARLGGVDVVSFQVTGNLARGLCGEVDRYRAWLARERFDVIMNYAAQAWPTDATLTLLSDLRAATVLATCGFSGMYGARRLLYWRYFRLLAQLISNYRALVYHTRAGADVRFGRRYGPAVQEVIPNGADGREFDQAPSGFRQRHDIGTRYMLLHVGNHYRVKRHRHLTRVMHALRDVDATLVLIGEAASGGRGCWDQCCRAAARNPRLRLLRGLPRAEVVAAYREADLFLLTSAFEVAPLVLVEAMAGGLPFVSYAVGNVSDLAGGVIVRGTEPMAQAVRSLLADEGRRQALGRAGQDMQRRALEWDRVVDRYEALYTQLIRQAGQIGGGGS